jgi:uncharacterized tellurite resistance protein B-like protein
VRRYLREEITEEEKTLFKAVNSQLISDIDVTLYQGKSSEHYSGVFLVAALLIYVSKGDGAISSQESDEMLATMTTHLSISNAEALENLRKAIMVLPDDRHSAAKLRSIAHELSLSERRQLLQLMFNIAGVDGDHHTGELVSINMAAKVLGLSKSEVSLARQASGKPVPVS